MSNQGASGPHPALPKGNVYFIALIRQWLRDGLERRLFQSLAPILEHPGTLDQRLDFDKIQDLPPPPASVFKIPRRSQVSRFEAFVMSLLPNRSHIFVYFLGFVPAGRINALSSRFLSAGCSFASNILTRFPRSPALCVALCEKLRNEATFLGAFALLFGDLSGPPDSPTNFISRSFRGAVSQRVGCAFPDRLLHTLFTATSSRPFDIFFSAFTDCPAILVQYFGRILIDDVIKDLPDHSDLPVSFLKFLIFTNSTYHFPGEGLRDYLLNAPSLLFLYLFQIPSEEDSAAAWRLLLRTVWEIPGFTPRLNALFGFLVAVSHHPTLSVLIPEIGDRLIDFFSDDPNLAAFTIVMVASQFSDPFARRFASTIDRPLFQDDPINNVTKVVQFVLEPFGAFPLADRFDVICPSTLERAQFRAHFFCQAVVPLFLPRFLLNLFEGSRVAFADMVDFILQRQDDREFDLLYASLADPALLHALAPCDDRRVRQLVVRALAISCDFDVFDRIFTSLTGNVGGTISFLNVFAEQSPLVDEFIIWADEVDFPHQLLDTTLAMWIRGLGVFAPILKIRLGSALAAVSLDNKKLWIIFESRIVFQHSLRNSIENWCLIVLNCTAKGLEFFVNLERFCIDVNCGYDIRFTLSPIFQLQSLQVVKPVLSFAQVMHLFTIGPAVKNLVIENFLQIADRTAYFVQEGFISRLFAEFCDLFDQNDKYLETIGVHVELAISPPFEEFAAKPDMKQGPPELMRRKWSFVPMFNALDAHGGIDLVVHLFVEALLRAPDLRALAFRFLNNLLNRFPLVHGYFEKNGVYDMFEGLNLDIPEVYSQDILTNARLVKAFVKAPQDFRVSFSPHNIKFLNLAKTFQSLVLSLSDASEALMEFALRLTDSKHHREHTEFVFDVLMVHHVKFSSVASDRTALPILALFERLLPCDGIRFELMLPALLTTGVEEQLLLIRIFLRHLSGLFDCAFSLFLARLNDDERLRNGLFEMVNDIPQHRVSFIVFFFTSHPECQALLRNVVNDQLTLINEWENVNPFIYDQILFSVPYLTDEYLQSDVTPVVKYVVAVLKQALALENCGRLKKLFLALLAVDKVPEARLIAVSFVLMNHVMNQAREPFVNFSLKFGAYLLERLKLFPQIDTAIIFSFILNCFEQPLSNRVIRRIFDFLLTLASLNLDNSVLLGPFQQTVVLSENRRFSQTKDRLTSPLNFSHRRFGISYLPRIQKLERNLHYLGEFDLLSMTCDSVHYQAIASHRMDQTTQDFGTLVEHWRQLFLNLQISTSHIYDNCPTKYGVSDSARRIESRRMLFPLNPSTDPCYLSHWAEKYHTEVPEVRLKMSDVLHSTGPSVSLTCRFNEIVTRRLGFLAIQGFLILTDDRLRFHDESCHGYLSLCHSEIQLLRTVKNHHQDLGICVEDSASQVYLFAFDSVSRREAFLAAARSVNINIETGFDHEYLALKKQQWLTGKISNFCYLLTLNILSGRTWTDFSQFPLVPWVILDFQAPEIDLTDVTVYRDLSFPLFAQGEEARQHCQQYFSEALELQGTGVHFPNYVSNISSTIFYLVRLEPFTTREIEFQGGRLDSADRTFSSVALTQAMMVTSGTSSSLECVPEFYHFPEMFENLNRVAFPRAASCPIDSVALPPWAKSSEHFVWKLRRALESPYVSSHLHEWIDLIWGFRRSGQPAFEKYNIFGEYHPEQYMEDAVAFNGMMGILHNCGIAPTQLFTRPHEQRRSVQQFGFSVLKFDSWRRATDQQLNSLKFDDGTERWHSLASRLKVRLVRNSIQFQVDKLTSAYIFRPEIRPTLIYTSGEKDVATAHALPFVNLWQVTGQSLCHVATLKGHLAAITSIFFSVSSLVVAAGHCDGQVSVFSFLPVRFLRILVCEESTPVVAIKVVRDTSDLLVFQEARGDTVLSAFSLNGKSLRRVVLENCKVRDGVSTSFAHGTRKNLVVLLTGDAKLIVLDTRKFVVRSVVAIDKPDPVALFVCKNQILGVTHRSKHVSCYQIEPDANAP
jgi:hypothetical protein